MTIYMASESFIWILYGLASVLELSMYMLKVNKSKRIYIGGIALLLLAAVHAMLLLGLPMLLAVPFFITGLYRLLNLMRFIYGRMNDRYLYKVVRKSALILIAVQIALVIMFKLFLQNTLSLKSALFLLVLIQLGASIILLISLIMQLKISKLNPNNKFISDSELPTLTVAIPARNETEDLADCLKSLINSTYTKLEILVLDDCSHDNSSDVIKQFAHEGVRFIRGSEPGDTWLPKNAAYNSLAKEASSEFILFCGVDVRMAPETLYNLVNFAVQSKLEMVSILPTRSSAASFDSITQQIRYLWELALPRPIGNRPPVLSTAWLINAKSLKNLGGLGAVKRAVVPEGYFARELQKQTKYQFVRANTKVMIESTKDAKAQRETALRVRYPQLHRRPELVLATSTLELVLILSSLPIALYANYKHFYTVTIIALMSVIVFSALLILGVFATERTNRFLHVLQSFGVIAFDVWLLNYSMFLYEFYEIRWKERNVCLPVMHVVPTLPKVT